MSRLDGKLSSSQDRGSLSFCACRCTAGIAVATGTLGQTNDLRVDIVRVVGESLAGALYRRSVRLGDDPNYALNDERK